jgi:hypothetical protein
LGYQGILESQINMHLACGVFLCMTLSRQSSEDGVGVNLHLKEVSGTMAALKVISYCSLVAARHELGELYRGGRCLLLSKCIEWQDGLS